MLNTFTDRFQSKLMGGKILMETLVFNHQVRQ